MQGHLWKVASRRIVLAETGRQVDRRRGWGQSSALPAPLQLRGAKGDAQRKGGEWGRAEQGMRPVPALVLPYVLGWSPPFSWLTGGTASPLSLRILVTVFDRMRT